MSEPQGVACKDVLQWYAEECARAAREGFKLLCAEPWTHYLYYRQGAIVIAGETPEGYALACPERVPGDRTVEQLAAWINARCARVACLPKP